MPKARIVPKVAKALAIIRGEESYDPSLGLFIYFYRRYDQIYRVCLKRFGLTHEQLRLIDRYLYIDQTYAELQHLRELYRSSGGSLQQLSTSDKKVFAFYLYWILDNCRGFKRLVPEDFRSSDQELRQYIDFMKPFFVKRAHVVLQLCAAGIPYEGLESALSATSSALKVGIISSSDIGITSEKISEIEQKNEKTWNYYEWAFWKDDMLSAGKKSEVEKIEELIEEFL